MTQGQRTSTRSLIISKSARLWVRSGTPSAFAVAAIARSSCLRRGLPPRCATAAARLASLLQDGPVLVHPIVTGELALGHLSRRIEIVKAAQQSAAGEGCDGCRGAHTDRPSSAARTWHRLRRRASACRHPAHDWHPAVDARQAPGRGRRQPRTRRPQRSGVVTGRPAGSNRIAQGWIFGRGRDGCLPLGAEAKFRIQEPTRPTRFRRPRRGPWPPAVHGEPRTRDHV